jgi:hypothetical protein
MQSIMKLRFANIKRSNPTRAVLQDTVRESAR